MSRIRIIESKFIDLESYLDVCLAQHLPHQAANEKLLQFLREGRDWEKKVTNIPGIFDQASWIKI